ncbi:ABC-F family ATP-binding cassette domain-containing protein [Streptomyces sp. WMMC897]|uniref:ABC-F family ATP-binding cassette domain-containing protein n=1 Tax=Streptomyces sp. WMMC897 TaxID=3014782 RepID=UPI0022B74E6B|nr:ABC-F family ATP-binding cassette domain-containing protein [Streptomyces sp. WMMC897]MCZ7415786.1 ABC-F family ATP-binding cassette domain-containing protein [Streptomyces sp. WMMC897]
MSTSHLSSTARTNLSITASGLAFAWPDGTTVFDGLDLLFGTGRTGLIGRNGSGKSTLLKLMAGVLDPTAGSLRLVGEVGYLPQDVTLATGLRVDEALGMAERRAALHAIESGDAREEHFTVLGDDWDVEERARATLGSLGLSGVQLDHTIGEMSGGECVLLRLAALLLRRPDVLLLDEPTNNLDLTARQRLYEAVDGWSGLLVVVSHDRELLERVDRIADLDDGSVRLYGGGYSAYEEALATEQAAAERMVRVAEADVQRQKRELTEALQHLAARDRYAKKMYANKREPRAVMRMRARTAQVSAGKHRILHEQRLAEARERLTEAAGQVREDKRIRVDLPATAVPPARQVLTLREVALRCGVRATFDIHGPERIALIGANGAGKSTLLHTIAGRLPAAEGTITTQVPARLLPQRLDVLDEELSIVENVTRLAPRAGNNGARAQLARFLFRGRRADQVVGTLSGGERFRATLAALLLAEPAPQLLLLDEPTNNLDLASVEQLTTALEAYRGALVVAGHDLPFLRSLGITRWLRVDGEVHEVDPATLA